tara:strand:+ start:763 stop:1209 length:447 start_codon:yes stop_codon:yes gene_type:complete
MKSYFYVTPEEDVADYVDLTALLGMPVIQGVPEKILKDHPDITPDSSKILPVPEHRGIEMRDRKVLSGDHQAILYVDEFRDLRTGTHINVFNKRSDSFCYENLKPQFVENHRARWVFKVPQIGKYSVTVFHESEEVSEVGFIAFKSDV